ncbi:hypothetical protein MPSEU_000425200 [Mayamaea pseudoterrestris]|nr:hypothetical protein MPSEU_000425200 [Mayamaea pseudoterrestris]
MQRMLLSLTICLLPLTVTGLCSKLFTVSPVHQHRCKLFSKTDSFLDNHQQHLSNDAAFILPVFPLRKTVRLPTERLTLNLYEDRYLTLAETIVSSDNPSFGAIYSSNKAQMVTKGGRGMIVPLLEPGDVGTIFNRVHSRQDMIPTIGGRVHRRRIRLVALGTARFQITMILHHGYGNDYSLPYIVVQAQHYNDDRQSHDCATTSNWPSTAEGTDVDRTVMKEQRETSKSFCLESEIASFAHASARLGDEEIDKRLRTLKLQCANERSALINA